MKEKRTVLKKNEIHTLKILSMTNLGFGVARVSGCVIFVQGAVTGDELEAKIIKVTASYAVAKVERIIKASEIRTDERCDVRGCSSCAYKCIDYSHEIEIKEHDVKEAFIKAGLPDTVIAPLVPSPMLSEYRNKAQYPIALTKDGDYAVGFFAPKSHRVCEARSCPLAPKVFREIIDLVCAFFKKHSTSVYDEESGEGLLRHIYLRRGEVSGEILLTLVITKETRPCSDELVKSVTEEFPDVVGVLLNVNPDSTNVILGEKFITLFGRDHIFDSLGGNTLKISAPSFYQVNHSAAELLYKKAGELARPTKDDVLLDLYCGAGSIGLSMAKVVKELIGIEIVDAAVLCARENADANGITNARFYTGDATNTEKMLENAEAQLEKKIEPSIIVLDPPRAGCDERLINYVAALSPKRIVYISCNPTTLARDSKLFEGLGYAVGEVTPFDLFPTTGHVESITCLERK